MSAQCPQSEDPRVLHLALAGLTPISPESLRILPGPGLIF
jgi:hypothetical protein